MKTANPGAEGTLGNRPYVMLVLLVVWVAGALYAWHYLGRGWWPNNAGAFSLNAERVLGGELPHRDFDEIYTGGLNYYHALAFKLFGTTLAATRWALFAVFVTWVPSVYYLATRFAGPLTSGLVVLLAVAWSLPIYSEPISSWYNLFLATHGTAALLRFFETKHRGWLLVAGVMGGLSFLAKIVGLYFVAAAGLALLFWEQAHRANRSSAAAAASPPAPVLAWAYRGVIALGLGVVVAVLAIGIYPVGGRDALYAFVVPVALLTGLIVHREVVLPANPGSSLRELSRLLLPFVVGFGLPLLPFLLPYVLSGSVSDLVHGLFVSPQARFSVTAASPPPLLLFSLPFIVMLAVTWHPSKRVSTVLAISPIPPLIAFAWLGSRWPNYAIVVTSIRLLVPVSVAAGVIMLLRVKRMHPGVADPKNPTGTASPLHTTKVFTLLAAASFCALVQFPQAEEIYIFFVAPLALIALVAVYSYQGAAMRPLFVVGLAFYFAFSVVWVNRAIHYASVVPQFGLDRQTEAFTLDRARGIRVREQEKVEYETLIGLLRERWPGEYIFATPDCAEIYFLAGAKNPTRITYDFFDEQEGRAERLQAILEDKGVNVVVVNRNPQYSDPVDATMLTYFQARYPNVLDLQNFQVRWKD